jgi:hypothetical protein
MNNVAEIETNKCFNLRAEHAQDNSKLTAGIPFCSIVRWSLHPTALTFVNWYLCPNQDLRNPAFIDVYNAALQRVVAAAASAAPSNPPKYLDTSFITRPMWDYTSDSSHSSTAVSDARALYFAATLLDVF